MRKRGSWGSTWLLCTVVALAATLAVPDVLARGDVLPFGFRLEQIATGGARASGVAVTSGGWIFYCERTTGNVRLVKNGVLEPNPVVTVAVPGTPGGNEGLLDVAVHPDFASNHWFYVFYSDAAKVNRIVRYTESGGTGTSPLTIATLGTSVDGTRVGGSMAFGADGKLYVATGDLAASGNAQDEASLAGKVLRLNADGSVPSDNPVPGSRVYSKGFRSGSGLSVNTRVGTLYQADQGSSTLKEELNAIPSGNPTMTNYAWDIGAGKLNNPAYVDPIVELATQGTPTGTAAYTGSRWPASYANDVFYACQGTAAKPTGKIEQVDVTGAKFDTFVSSLTFLDPARNGETTPDVGCPRKWSDLATGPDGNLYLTVDTGAATSANNGLFRVIYSPGGAREVSAANTFPLFVKRVDATHVRVTFEDLRVDADVRTPLAAGQHNDRYTLWKGSLPIDTNHDGVPNWSHTAAVTGDGTAAASQGTRSLDATVGATTSEYFLVSAQNANFEGPLGFGSNGTAVPGYATTDYCGVLGTDPFTDGKCMPMAFRNKNGVEVELKDEFGVPHKLSEYRDGRVLHIDLSANDCSWCQVQAEESDEANDKYRARGTRTIVVFEEHLSGARPYPTQEACAAGINAWRAAYGGTAQTYVMLCDVETDGDGYGDVWIQLDRPDCGGFPENYYIDRNWVVWENVCGYEAGGEDTHFATRAWPAWCE